MHHISIKSIKQQGCPPSFCPPIVIPKLMMSHPGPPARAGVFDNPGCNENRGTEDTVIDVCSVCNYMGSLIILSKTLPIFHVVEMHTFYLR